MAGPGIRYYNFARELSKEFQVTLFTTQPINELPNDIIVEKMTKKNLLNAIDNSSVLVAQGNVIWNNPFIKHLNIPIIIDLYDPFVLEELELNKESDARGIKHKIALSILLDQVKFGDYFICSSEVQRNFWLGCLMTLNKINSESYDNDYNARNLIDVVPFGLSNDPIKRDSESILKGVFKGIEVDDKVVLWGGGVWDWLDPITAVRAMNEIYKVNRKVKLVFLGIKHPNSVIGTTKKALETIELSKELGLFNKCVFFNEWASYDDRVKFLQESDIGLSLHNEHLETKFSFRTRILDYIWAGLPIIATEGDYFSSIIKEYDLGIVVKENDPQELATAILSLLEKNIDKNFDIIRDDLKWSNVVKPLIRLCNMASKKPYKQNYKSHVFKNKKISILYQTIYYLKKGKITELIEKIIRCLKV